MSLHWIKFIMIKIKKLDNNGYRNFGLTMAVFFTAMFGIVLPFVFSFDNYIWPFVTSIIFVFLALFTPRWLMYLHILWMTLGHYLGIINTTIILTLVFIVIFVPMAFLLKIFGKDPMRRSKKQCLDTYWISSKQPPKEQMEKIY